MFLTYELIYREESKNVSPILTKLHGQVDWSTGHNPTGHKHELVISAQASSQHFCNFVNLCDKNEQTTHKNSMHCERKQCEKSRAIASQLQKLFAICSYDQLHPYDQSGHKPCDQLTVQSEHRRSW